jgi:hypothetical protein
MVMLLGEDARLDVLLPGSTNGKEKKRQWRWGQLGERGQ